MRECPIIRFWIFSDLTMQQKPNSKHETEELQSPRKEKSRPQRRIEEQLNDSDGHMHTQGSSIH
jgi:hypothetical protein